MNSGSATIARVVLLVALASGLRPAAALPQATLRGTVRAQGGGPLESADVELRRSGRVVKTGADGRFVIGLIKAGDYVVSVRAVGYRPLEADAELRGSDTLTVAFELERSVQVLESLHVEAPAVHIIAKMVGFEERRKAGIGRFYTRDDLAKREHSPLSNVLRMTGGMVLIRRPFECADGFAPASGRGMAIRWLPWMNCNGYPMAPACYMSIYLDGARIWVWGNSEIPDIDQLISVNGVEGIEAYRGPSELPVQFQATGSACGAVLLWTRN